MGTFVADDPPDEERTLNRVHRDPDPVGKRNVEMCIIEDVAARLIRFENAMYTCQAGLGKAFAQFRVRSTIRWAVVSVHRKSRRRYKVTFPDSNVVP